MIDETAVQQPAAPTISLKDPVMAAFLAWLIPGLGHLYQGRKAKAVLFFVCIMGIFTYGIYLGGNSEFGYGRAVYFAWRSDEWRLPFLAQIGVGLPTMPACIQAMRMNNDKRVFLHGFMAPPKRQNARDNDANFDQPNLDALQFVLNRYFELATVFTMIAGLLNVLAIYDAWSGPVLPPPPKKKEQPHQPEKKSE